MAIELIAKIKPKNNGDFSMVDAVDVEMADGTRLEDTAAKLASTLTAIGQMVGQHSAALVNKQNTLVSGQNIKTINGESILGSGNIEIKDGVSPSVSVTAITGGHRVSITDASGTKTFDVMDGEDGKDGEDGSGATLPIVTSADAGKVLAVNENGEWVAMEMAVSADLPSAEEASF